MARIDSHLYKCKCGNLRLEVKNIYVLSKDKKHSQIIEKSYICTRCKAVVKTKKM